MTGRVVPNNRFFLKSDAANGFSYCITLKNDNDQFSQKNFDVKGVRNSILVYDVIKKAETFFRKTLARDISTDAE